MTDTSLKSRGSYRTPSYEHATVGDAMRLGVISCPAETPLRQVARMMATEHIHCVVVMQDRGWGVVTDSDLIRAAEGDLDTTTAGEVAGSAIPRLTPGDPLDRAARLMVEHEVSHVLVVDGTTGHATGVLSTLDVAGVLAWGEA
ncbi:MAG TPA: CBS domain-containing protein [Solirubrobacterales bacterium]|jgi:CBS domain-containing protein